MDERSRKLNELVAKISVELNEAFAESHTIPEVVQELINLGYTIDLTLEAVVRSEATHGKAPSRGIVTVALTEEEQKFFSRYESQLKSST